MALPMSSRSGRFTRENGTDANVASIMAPVPNGPTLPLTVSGAGVVALPMLPPDTTSLIIINPNAAVTIAFCVTATANLGMTFSAKQYPALTSPEQIATASIYWAAADAGACVQPMK